ncbi:putative vacuolar amino acid transporter YPQ2 [Nakaseomyces glabratus]|nr:putative vacuolar amino acid transporter YPQ2 [Nakaseomyces glabratus]KTB15300.1 putative vacuolar amino acid transporter YPQ2 [Nakaseomyces glabratus]
MSCARSLWPFISNINGSVSFLSSFVSLFPQIIETYKDKTVEGLSPLFLMCWLCGDITSLVGALMTGQLKFQIALAIYFLFNDLFVCCQYYYYGVLHENKLATVGHETVPVISSLIDDGIITVDENGLQNTDSRPETNMEGSRLSNSSIYSGSRATRSLLANALVSVKSSNAQQILSSLQVPPNAPYPGHTSRGQMGVTLSWLGASFYVGARIPQLIKNYQRKSTDGLSPFLFATTLLGNITYNISIFTSCNFLDTEDKMAFIFNELPFIFGSAGTVAFDLIYFYQYYVLYSRDNKLRELEREIYDNNEDETTPLID